MKSPRTAPVNQQHSVDVSAIPSLQERLRNIEYALILAQAALAGVSAGHDNRLLGTALGKILTNAEEDLYWIKLLPAVLVNMPVPTDDDVDTDDGYTSHQENHERFFAKYIRDTFTAGGER